MIIDYSGDTASRGTIGRLIISALARFADRDMISDGTVHWTYRQLGDQIGRSITVLRELGLKRGDGIAILTSNRATPWAILCAANLMGIRYTPMHPLAAEDDHVHIVSDSMATILCVDSAKFADRARAIRERVPALGAVLSLGPSGTLDDICARIDAARPSPLVDEAESEDIAWLVYTGGTTGRSKGVMLSHRAIVAMNLIISSEWEWPVPPRYAMVTPISHAGGINLYPILHRGGYARLLQGWDTADFCATVEKEKLNCTFLVPTIINTLIDAVDIRTRHDLSSLEMIIYGAAPMSPDRLREGIGIFGPVFLQLYGQSECPQTMTTLRKADHDLDRPERLGSCGLPASTMEIRLLDSELREVAVGEPGEICARGPLVMSGYWQQPDMTEQAFAGGWLHTGDVGVRDAEGYITIVDRTKDMIISGGFNIYPREVEDALMSHPAVALAAVIGIPDPKWGEAVTAFVTLRAGSSVDTPTLQQLVKEKRGAPWSPKTIEFASDLPLTGLGKLDRKALRAPYWEGKTRAVS